MKPNQTNEATTYKSIALKGSAVVIASQFIKTALVFASTIILSQLLLPADFGLIACIAPVAAFIVLLQDIGLQQAVVQRDTISKEQLNRIFWLVSVFGCMCATFLCLISPAIAWFYHDERLLKLTLLAALPLLISGMASLPVSLLNRTMQFGKIAAIDTTANIVGFIGAVTGALLGMSYWSLMISPILVALITMMGALWASGWVPTKPDFKIEKDILKFGANLTGFNIANFFSRNLDNILIGRYADTVQLGYYDRAYKLLLFPLAALNAPLARVIIPILSRVQDDKPRMRQIYLRVVGILTLVTVPGMAAVTIIPEEIIRLLFGENWLPVAPIFCWLGISALIQTLNNTTGWIFISQGKTKEMFHWGIFSSLTTIASFIAGLHWGAVGVAAAYTISEYAIRLPCMFWYMNRIGPIRAHDYIRIQAPLLIAAALCWAAVHFVFQGMLQFNGITLIAAAILCSYLIAMAVCALHASGRTILFEIYQLCTNHLKLTDKTNNA